MARELSGEKPGLRLQQAGFIESCIIPKGFSSGRIPMIRRTRPSAIQPASILLFPMSRQGQESI